MNKLTKNPLLERGLRRLYILFGISLFLISCNDSFLNRYPLDALTDETYWETEEHLKLASNACINYLREKARVVDMEFMGDNLYRERSSSYKTIGSGSHASDLSTINTEWATNYDGIRRCNHFLENYERAEKVPEATRERYAAEARFMRAYNYVYLVNFFGNVPMITKTLDINDPEVYGKREDKEVVIDWVLSELEQAKNHLKWAKDLKADEFGRPTKESAWALSSRFALYHERWDIAVASADSVMKSGHHKLYDNGNPATSYYEMFTHAGRASRNTANKEFILTRIYSEEALKMHNWSRELQVPNEEARAVPTRSLMDAYLCNGLPITVADAKYRENTYEAIFNNRDPRLAQTVLKPGEKWGGNPSDPTFRNPKFSNDASSCRTPSGWYFTKMVETSYVMRQSKDDNDIPLIRYAEVLLNWIEAKAMRGDNITQNDINQSINLLRQRVGAEQMLLAKLNAYGLDLIDEIRRERRVELAMEGERYFDIIRWGQGHLLAEDITGMRKTNVPADQYQYVKDMPTDDKGNFILMTRRSFISPKHNLWPVPFTQYELNPALLPNNEGW